MKKLLVTVALSLSFALSANAQKLRMLSTGPWFSPLSNEQWYSRRGQGLIGNVRTLATLNKTSLSMSEMIVTEFDIHGNITSEAYVDLKGLELRTVSEDSYVYDSAGKLIKITNSLRDEPIKISVFVYDSTGRLSEITEKDPDDSLYARILFSYDPKKKTVKETYVESESLLFRVSDLQDPLGIAIKISASGDPWSEHLRAQFAVTKREASEKSKNPPLTKLVLETLNRLLRGSSLYTEERFKHVVLSQEARELLNHNPTGENLVRLNRLLLEHAYPNEIAKSRKNYERIVTNDGNGRYTEEYYTARNAERIKKIYYYDTQKNILNKIEYPTEKDKGSASPTIFIYRFDSQGNWIGKHIVLLLKDVDGKSFQAEGGEIERTIKYY